MQFDQESAAKLVHPTVALSAVDMAKLLDVKDREIVHLRRQVAWFQRQIFGQKSERRLPEPEGIQGHAGRTVRDRTRRSATCQEEQDRRARARTQERESDRQRRRIGPVL
ncbi:hypothetical protein HHL21_09740 [Massilia sp. RP-1-19]|uniref:Transposase TnpC homeodomain domain-containing protein n=1 Tax=Massilia polaris TaxID=2728846 RepID=A0A848HJR3_9BURK|nr:hypothetical protein [Massilia polaris]NML61352.1 hypothetical protein [Massilia polaris]